MPAKRVVVDNHVDMLVEDLGNLLDMETAGNLLEVKLEKGHLKIRKKLYNSSVINIIYKHQLKNIKAIIYR